MYILLTLVPNVIISTNACLVKREEKLLMKRVLKLMLKIVLVVVILVVLLIVILLVKNYIQSKKPLLSDDYYTWFQSDSSLEMKYTGVGTYEVSSKVVKSEDKAIGNIRIWYPTELESKTDTYPMIMVVNASNTAALNYEPYFKRLASWGFVVVGNDDRQTGTGITASETLDYMLKENENGDSVFYGKINVDKLGITGYSQGGAGALRAVTEYENGTRYKAIFTGSAAHAYLSQMWGGYDPSKVSIPWFMTAGTGTSDDTGKTDATKEWLGVAPLSSLIENYNAMSDDVFKIRARVAGAEHEEMLNKTDGYMTAWMLWQLKGDDEAEKVFIGDSADILNNSGWQDIEKSR